MPLSFRAQLIRLAHAHPEYRADLLPLLSGESRVAKEFPTEEALKKYLEQHPGADPSKHWVKGEKPGDDKPQGKGKGKIKVKVDEKQLEKRKPKVDSKDLTKYPDDAKADDLAPEHREEIKDYKLEVVGDDARQAVEIARKVREGIEKGADICKMSPPVCEGNMGLTRDKMPQIVDKSPKALLASDDPEDQAKGKAMVAAGADPDDDRPVLNRLLDHLSENGIDTEVTEIPVGMLKATQSEIKAEKTFNMADSHLKGKFDNIDASVIVSRDGHILDGHHRWAALLTIDPARKMKVKVIDMDMKDLLNEAASLPGVFKADFEGNPLPEADQKKYKEDHKSQFKGKGKKASNLRARLIRLAYKRPEYREQILPLL